MPLLSIDTAQQRLYPPASPVNIAAFLEQDYAGEAEYIFVVPSRGDPAFEKSQAFSPGDPSGHQNRLFAHPGAP
ncbi:MAG TPA: hypothetical protein DCZ93_02895 [Elusimicrobia bacterium]|nr:hypothetical protein [Elusimicrobiota bacterium]